MLSFLTQPPAANSINLLALRLEPPVKSDGAKHLPVPFSGAALLKNYLGRNQFYINPRFKARGFGLDSIVEVFHLSPRVHADISPRAVCELHCANDAQDARLEEICDWKIQTVRKVVLAIEHRCECR